MFLVSIKPPVSVLGKFKLIANTDVAAQALERPQWLTRALVGGGIRQGAFTSG